MKTCRPYTQRHCFMELLDDFQQNTYNTIFSEKGEIFISYKSSYIVHATFLKHKNMPSWSCI